MKNEIDIIIYNRYMFTSFWNCFLNDIDIYKLSTIDVKLIDNDPFIASRQRKIILKSAKVQSSLRKRKKGVSLVWDISILISFRKSSYESAKWIN